MYTFSRTYHRVSTNYIPSNTPWMLRPTSLEEHCYMLYRQFPYYSRPALPQHIALDLFIRYNPRIRARYLLIRFLRCVMAIIRMIHTHEPFEVVIESDHHHYQPTQRILYVEQQRVRTAVACALANSFTFTYLTSHSLLRLQHQPCCYIRKCGRIAFICTIFITICIITISTGLCQSNHKYCFTIGY